MKNVKQYILPIEIGVILLLFFLLNLGGNKEEPKKINNKVLETEHAAPEQAVKPTEAPDIEKPTTTPTPDSEQPTPTPKPENPLDGYSEEVVEAYNKAMELIIPEGIAFANVQESMSIRVSPKGDSQQVGTMYPMNACIIQSVDGEWAKVKSGSVEGYCRVKYLIRDEEAMEMAPGLVVRKAKTTANVNIRSSATTLEDNVIRSVEAGKTFTVTTPAVLSEDPDAPLFVEIKDGEKTAYVAIGKVNLSYSWTYAKSN